MTLSHKNQGFSLVELMVGIVIGLIATLIIFQVFVDAERQKRTTTGTADIQSDGVIALAAIGQSARMAGSGLYGNIFAACDAPILAYKSNGTPIDTNQGISLLQPAMITDGGTGPDSLTFLYYHYPTSNDVRLSTILLAQDFDISAPNAPIAALASRNCSKGGLALIRQGNTCVLMSITGGSSTSIEHDEGTGYNPPAATFAGVAPFAQNNSALQCFDGLYRTTYSISGSTLQATEPGPGTPDTFATSDIAPNVVDMQAEYGINTAFAANGNTIGWFPATGTYANLGVDNARAVFAVRVALLMRSPEFQKPDGLGNCTATTTAQIGNMSDWATFDTARLATLDPQWDCYRYKVFEQTIPLKNTVWNYVK